MTSAPQPSIPPDDADAADPLSHALRAAAPLPPPFSEALHQRALARIAAEPVAAAPPPRRLARGGLAAATALAAAVLLAAGLWRNPTPRAPENPLAAASPAASTTAESPSAGPPPAPIPAAPIPAAPNLAAPNLAAPQLARATLAAARAFERRVVDAQRLLTAWKTAPASKDRPAEAPRPATPARGFDVGWNLVRKELTAVRWIGTAPRRPGDRRTVNLP